MQRKNKDLLIANKHEYDILKIWNEFSELQSYQEF